MGKPTPDGQRGVRIPFSRRAPVTARRPARAQLGGPTRKRIRDGRPQAALAQIDPRCAYRRDRLHRRGERPGRRAQSAWGVPPGAASLRRWWGSVPRRAITPPRTPRPPRRGPEPGPAVVEPPPGAVRAPSSPPARSLPSRRRALDRRPPAPGSRRAPCSSSPFRPAPAHRRMVSAGSPPGLVSPVRAGGATVLPAGTTAVLHLRRGGNPVAPRARLDSLVRPTSPSPCPRPRCRSRAARSTASASVPTRGSTRSWARA